MKTATTWSSNAKRDRCFLCLKGNLFPFDLVGLTVLQTVRILSDTRYPVISPFGSLTLLFARCNVNHYGITDNHFNHSTGAERSCQSVPDTSGSYCQAPCFSRPARNDAMPHRRCSGYSGHSDRKKCVLIYCADHGVVARNISQSDHTVTTRIARSLSQGHASVCAMAASCHADTFPVDMGMVDPVPSLRDCRIDAGTRDFTRGPAMTRKQAVKAIMTGVKLAQQKSEEGYHVIATGEAGIGNTTASSAVASVLLHLPLETVTGRGAGLTNAGLERKKHAIAAGIRLNQPDAADPVDVLSKVGGFDIAAMCGTFLGGAHAHTPVIIDGLISAVAALCAFRLCPAARDYMLPSHLSEEPAAGIIMNQLRLKPLLHAEMHLGEGTGAVLLFPVIDMAASVYYHAAAFEEIGILPYQRLS